MTVQEEFNQFKAGITKNAINQVNKMSKQTAVEWLVEQILKEKGLVDLDIVQAKQMEKQQIMEAFKEGYKNNGWLLKHEMEQYYNETYKKKEK